MTAPRLPWAAPLPRPLPEPLRPLVGLALDLRWTWSHGSDGLWRDLDAELWGQTRSPWLMLQLVPAARLAALASDEVFLAEMRAQTERRRREAESPTWFAGLGEPLTGCIAHFSMEYGLHESLPVYAGGLGILAGDHLKTASDLGVPLVGVGILWQQGYFRQVLDGGGRQQELYPHNDPATLPIQRLLNPLGDPLEVSLELPGRLLRLRGWVAEVGRTQLYLLDANHPLNAPPDRGITASLYASDAETRLLQELILGIGGWRLLRALGRTVDVCHLNEGHAAFVVVERARSFMQDHGVSFHEALWATRAGNVFTTHTPLAAGFDAFGEPLIERYTTYFAFYVQRLGITWPDLLALGRLDGRDESAPFNMAYLAVRGSARVNGVSLRHGEVSRRLFQQLFPRWPEREVPVVHVTNGVHVPSWDSAEADALWTSAAGKERWRGEVETLAEALSSRSDEELWTLRSRGRAALVSRARERLHRQLAHRGADPDALALSEAILDPGALTVGFARRFTAYKRPNLLLRDPERLLRILTDPARPMQLLVAGKAHPADGDGKRMIAEWVGFASRPEARHRVVFLDDYDMELARELVEGVDLWLSTPLPPWEACGTSGMKVLVNGGLNLSVLDGWWVEAYSPECGWALGEPEPPASAPERDDADALYRLLETEVVPLFYARDAAGLPREWLRRVRASMSKLAPRFSSNRMLRQYVTELYVPAARDLRLRQEDGASLARELAAWAARVDAHWPQVRMRRAGAEVRGGALHVAALVWLGGLTPDDVTVELYAEPEHRGSPFREPMTPEVGGPRPGDPFRYSLVVSTRRPPDDFTIRVAAHHPHARLPLELPAIAWEDRGAGSYGPGGPNAAPM